MFAHGVLLLGVAYPLLRKSPPNRVSFKATLTLVGAIGAGDALPPDTAAALDALSLLDDAALHPISRSQPTVEDGVLLGVLVDKRQHQHLGPDAEHFLAELIDRYDRVMALRAEVIAHLALRGVNVEVRVSRA